MKLYIPKLRDILKLSTPWTFKLHQERINMALGEALGLEMKQFWYPTIRIPDPSGKTELVTIIDYDTPLINHRFPTKQVKRPVYVEVPNPTPEYYNVTLPADTHLIVDRIYIRKGSEDFDSVTFVIPKADKAFGQIRIDKKNTSVRFWAKLDDVNNIEFDLVED